MRFVLGFLIGLILGGLLAAALASQLLAARRDDLEIFEGDDVAPIPTGGAS
jgi:hypothetical protein